MTFDSCGGKTDEQKLADALTSAIFQSEPSTSLRLIYGYVSFREGLVSPKEIEFRVHELLANWVLAELVRKDLLQYDFEVEAYSYGALGKALRDKSETAETNTSTQTVLSLRMNTAKKLARFLADRKCSKTSVYAYVLRLLFS